MSESVALNTELNATITRVWEALTDSTLLSEWMFFHTHDFQTVVGHTFHLHSKQPGWSAVIDCEVLEVDAPHRLSYSWVIDAYRHHTQVTWTLVEVGDHVTRLHLEQSGFVSDATQEIGGANYAWTRQLEQLQSLLAK